MTLVPQESSVGPGTHALVIGAGAGLDAYEAAAAIRSARLIADWLQDGFNNPAAQLASLDLLLAESDEVEARYVTPKGDEVSTSVPTYEAVGAAIQAWRERSDTHPDNIAFLYFAGPAVGGIEQAQLALRDDRAEGGQALARFEDIRNAMIACKARRQIYLLDTRRIQASTSVSAPPFIPLEKPSGQPLLRVTLYSLVDAPHYVAAEEDTSLFALALEQTLRSGLPDKPGGAITVQGLVRRVDEWLKLHGPAGRTVLSRELGEDFDLHFPPPETGTEFVSDDAETERDELGRGVLAVALGRRLHKIWRKTNFLLDEGSADPPSSREAAGRAAFVIHLDAPWGGGKTTFANFLTRVLNPCPAGARRPALFLRESYGDADLGGIFIGNPPVDQAEVDALAEVQEDARRPWITVTFNAWQTEHCAPPWWVFYQAIRKSCFNAILKEGDDPWRPRLPPDVNEPWHRRAWRSAGRGSGRGASVIRRTFRWIGLWAGEYFWRLFNPKIRSLLGTALVSLALFLLLQHFNVVGEIGSADNPSIGYILGNGLGVVLAGLTGITALWGLGALITESIVPGTDSLSERLSLGGGDPFDRFRTHFHRMIARVRRPVMVVVDDLDRCSPEFVVELVRGIQTLLRSPRAVFVILGDRDWIERAFETHHEKMSKLDVGPEQSFGARFVEKAIQMSLLLPALGDRGRKAYVKRVLLGARPQGPGAPRPIARDDAVKLRKYAARALAKGADQLDSAPILEGAMRSLGRAQPGADLRDQVEQILNEELAINAAVSARFEALVSHQLEGLASYFPANPRQIKRIVNAITIYHAVALQHPDIPATDEEFRFQLALWIIIMTEWPQTWRLIASYPDLVKILTAPDPLAAVGGAGLALPGSVAATEKAVGRILADPDLMALIAGNVAVAHKPLLFDHIRSLRLLTPLYTRKRRLPDDEARPGDDEEQGGKDEEKKAVARSNAGSPSKKRDNKLPKDP